MAENLPKSLSVGSIGLGALVMGVVANYLFWSHTPGVSFVVFVIVYLGLLFGFCYAYGYRFSRRALWFVPGILFFSLMAAVRSNNFLTFLNVVATLGLCLLMAEYLTGFNIAKFTLTDYIKQSMLTVLGIIGRAFGAAAELARLRNSVRQAGKRTQIVRGILISLPILLLFVILFSSADLVFSHYVTNIFSFHIDPQIIGRLIFIAFFTFAFLGIFAYIFGRITVDVSHTPKSDHAPANFGAIESSILLGSLCALFLLFIVIQIKYLFAGQSAITDLGFTYAQYAHKGFVELNIAAVFTFLIVWALQKHIGLQNTGNVRWFKILVSILLLETFIILFSGFKRLSLYEDAYGFTSLRLYSHIFIIWLAVVFILLWYKVLKPHQASLLTFEGFISIIVFLIIINFLNPDAFIARQNIQRYYRSGKLDGYYMASLSPDATPVLTSFAKSSDATLKDAADLFFWSKRNQNHDGRFTDDWRSYNFAWQRAENAMEKLDTEMNRFDN